MRIIADIKASRRSDHVRVPRIIRTPQQILSDSRQRRSFFQELTHESNAAHEDFIFNVNSAGYSIALEEYVLSFVPTFVQDIWVSEDFHVALVSYRGIFEAINDDLEEEGIKADFDLSTINGLYRPRNKEILIREGTFPSKIFGSEQFWQNTEDVCGHEFGHYVDDILGFPSENDDMFLDAYKYERYKLETYSAVESREFFATSFWICMRYSKLARRYIPRTHRFFRTIIRENS